MVFVMFVLLTVVFVAIMFVTIMFVTVVFVRRFVFAVRSNLIVTTFYVGTSG